jgi:glutaminyl-peptide cyclotransferase
MQSYGWINEFDTFEDNTPFGRKKFTNLISTLPIGHNSNLLLNNINNHHNLNRIVLSCHYDSKYYDSFDFIGAIDSAVPCALLLDLAKFIQETYDKNELNKLSKRHIQFMFFDGEEAFIDWTSTDSLYGSRHLASKLFNNYSYNSFDSIDLFILLDLIGADTSQFLNYFPSTSHVYNLLAKIEKMLINNNKLTINKPYYFTDLNGYNGHYRAVDDDHRPFMEYSNLIILFYSPFIT